MPVACPSSHVPAYAPPSLETYFSGTTFQHINPARASSRPSSSSSSSSYTSSSSGGTFSDASMSTSPSVHSLHYAHGPSSCPPSATSSPSSALRLRPLPLPPTPQNEHRASLSPRPLPRPPLRHSQSSQQLRPHPLPTPPTPDQYGPRSAHFPLTPTPLPSPPFERRTPAAAFPPPSTTRSASSPVFPPQSQLAAAAIADLPANPTPERPTIRLAIPTTPAQVFVSPISPIAFNLPGPRGLRKRREEELERHMRALGFVEAPSPRDTSPRSPHPAASCDDSSSAVHTRRPSVASVASDTDDEKDVVLLVDADCDAEAEHADDDTDEYPRMRSESRATMRRLFTASACAPSPVVELPDWDAPRRSHDTAATAPPEASSDMGDPGADEAVDVEIEVVTKEAVARTRRRFSRKWVRERRGKRWTEKDFSEIISQLRMLR